MPNDEQPADDGSQPCERAWDQPGQTARGADLIPDATVTLERMEKLLGQIRGALDAAARAGEHREFSIGRLTACILEVIVVGLVALALLDWLLQGPVDSLLVKLAFAAVLQLSALTAFIVSGGDR